MAGTLRFAIEIGGDSDEAKAALRALEKEYRDTVKALQSQVGQVGAFTALKKSAAELGQSYQVTQARVGTLARALRDTAEPTRAQVREFEAAKKAAAALGAQYEKKQVEHEQLRRGLGEGGISTRNLATEQVRLKQALAGTKGDFKGRVDALRTCFAAEARAIAEAKAAAEVRAAYERPPGQQGEGRQLGGWAADAAGQWRRRYLRLDYARAGGLGGRPAGGLEQRLQQPPADAGIRQAGEAGAIWPKARWARITPPKAHGVVHRARAGPEQCRGQPGDPQQQPAAGV